jgi:hypothetical protein
MPTLNSTDITSQFNGCSVCNQWLRSKFHTQLLVVGIYTEQFGVDRHLTESCTTVSCNHHVVILHSPKILKKFYEFFEDMLNLLGSAGVASKKRQAH